MGEKKTHNNSNQIREKEIKGKEIKEKKIREEEEEKWSTLFHLASKNERSELEAGINVVVNCEQDEEDNTISLFLLDYGVKREMSKQLYPNCTLFLSRLYHPDEDSADQALNKREDFLQKLREGAKKMASRLTEENKNFNYAATSTGSGFEKQESCKRRVDLKFVDFNPRENILDTYLRERGYFISQNVCLYCFSSPRTPEICFGKENVKNPAFKTDFQYSIFNLSAYDERPDHEIILHEGLKPILDSTFSNKKYSLWKKFVTEYVRRDGRKPGSTLNGGLKKEKRAEIILRDPEGFLEWNSVKAFFLFIVFGTKLNNYNNVLKRSFSFKDQILFGPDFPNTADKMVEETFLRYLKNLIEEQSVIDNPEKTSNFYLFYFLMIKLGKLRTGLSRQDKEIVKNVLSGPFLESKDLIGSPNRGKIPELSFQGGGKILELSFQEKGTIPEPNSQEIDQILSAKGRGTIQEFLNIRHSNFGNRLLSFEDITRMKDIKDLEPLSEEDSTKINELFSIVRVDETVKQKECFEELCELSSEAVQFTCLECNSVNYFSSLHKETTAYLNGFPMSGFRSNLDHYQAPGFKDFPNLLREYSPFLRNVNHFVPFQFFSAALHFSPQKTPDTEPSSFHDFYSKDSFYGTLDLGVCLQNLVYPIGLPTVYAKTADQGGLTLKRFLNRYEKQLFPRLWKIIVSGTLGFKQHLLISSRLDDRFKKREEIYELTKMEAEKEMFKANDLSNLSEVKSSTNKSGFSLKKSAKSGYFKEFIENALITQDLLEQLKKVCSKVEMGQIYDLEVETAVFWKEEDRVESLQDWYYQATTDKGSFSYQEKNTALLDSRTKKWFPVELSEQFINPLIQGASFIREEYEKKGSVACEFDVRFLTDAIYRVLTSSNSICSNVVLADVIATRARVSIWQMQKSSDLSQEGYPMPSNPLLFRSKAGFKMKAQTRKPSLEKLDQMQLLRKHRNIENSTMEDLRFDLQQEFLLFFFYEAKRSPQSISSLPTSSEKDIDIGVGRLEEISEKDLSNEKRKELVERWEKIIKKHYRTFSHKDSKKLEEIVREKSQISHKINLITLMVRLQKFWNVYQLSCDLPSIMAQHKEESLESFDYA